MSCTFTRRASSTRGVSVRTAMPSSAGVLQAAIRRSQPSTSTTHTRQAPMSLTPLMPHSVGTRVPDANAAESMGAPSGTWTAWPFTVRFTMIAASLHGTRLSRDGRSEGSGPIPARPLGR